MHARARVHERRRTCRACVRTCSHERHRMPPRIVTVAAAKGGVGKTTLAYELAAALGGVLVDLDWDAGGATRMWGFDPTRAARAPLLDALERGPEGRPPRLEAARRTSPRSCRRTRTCRPAASTPTWWPTACGAWARAWEAPVRGRGHPPGRERAHRRGDAGGRPGGGAGRARRPRDGRPRGDRGRLRRLPAAAGADDGPVGAAAALRRAPGRPWPTGGSRSRRRSPSTAGCAAACAARPS